MPAGVDAAWPGPVSTLVQRSPPRERELHKPGVPPDAPTGHTSPAYGPERREGAGLYLHRPTQSPERHSAKAQ